MALNSISHVLIHSYILFICSSSKSLCFFFILFFFSNFASSAADLCKCLLLLSCHLHILKKQGLSYTPVILSPYLYLSSFSFNWCTFFTIITSSFIPFQVSTLLLGKTLIFCIVQESSFLQFFLCPLEFVASPFIFNTNFFLSVSSRLFNNLCCN